MAKLRKLSLTKETLRHIVGGYELLPQPVPVPGAPRTLPTLDQFCQISVGKPSLSVELACQCDPSLRLTCRC